MRYIWLSLGSAAAEALNINSSSETHMSVSDSGDLMSCSYEV